MSNIENVCRFFCCPHCGGDLYKGNDGLHCVRCRATVPITAGIPDLLPAGLRRDYGLTGHHAELNRRVREIGWRDAIFEHIETHHGPQGKEYAKEYICSEARADFRFLMPLENHSVILDIGSGWGNITTAFARTSQTVVALDTNVHNLEFVQLRAQQEKLDNVVVAQADACTLPVRPGTFDAATMVGVLEWVAWGREDAQPGQLQKRALERVHRALKPGGCLYIGIENRFSFKYFLGGREPHTKLRFVSLLPDALAQRYSQWARRQDYREITYSACGLRALLQSVGFDHIKFFFPLPGYQNFRFILDFEDKGTTRFVLERLHTHPKFSRIHWIAAQAGLALPLQFARLFWPSFSVIAVKS